MSCGLTFALILMLYAAEEKTLHYDNKDYLSCKMLYGKPEGDFKYFATLFTVYGTFEFGRPVGNAKVWIHDKGLWFVNVPWPKHFEDDFVRSMAALLEMVFLVAGKVRSDLLIFQA